MRRFFAICLAISLMLSLTIASAQAQDVSVMADNYRTANATISISNGVANVICIFLFSSSMAFAVEKSNDMYIERNFAYTEDQINGVNFRDIKTHINDDKNIEIKKMINESKNLTCFLDEIALKGEKRIGIGSATAYFDKEKGDKPLTVHEMAVNSGSGEKSKKGNLTIYTVATIGDGGLHAYTYAEWKSGSGSGNTTRATGDDKISITAQKSGLTVVNSGFSANTENGNALSSKRYHLEALEYTSVVFSFQEYDPVDSGKNVNFAVAGATYNGKVSAGLPYNCVSNYVHTWRDVDVSFSIGPTSCSANLTGVNYAWKLTSYLPITQGV